MVRGEEIQEIPFPGFGSALGLSFHQQLQFKFQLDSNTKAPSNDTYKAQIKLGRHGSGLASEVQRHGFFISLISNL
ncbi:hypothetical protein VNO77_20962 [Canavalia gladiata]|uniref:Uncharacterized protein n=1 Tax=Canavalia gladiata TaxID=3824 RepID=A0AAN9QR29_CANGL